MVAQLGLPVRIGQAAYIEHQVGIHRHAALEAEGLDQEGGARLGFVEQAQLDGVAQLVEVEAGGVDLQVGEVGDGAEQGGFVANRFGQRPRLVGQWMAPAGLGEALEQGLVVGIEEQHVTVDMPGADLVEQFGKALQLAGQVACVDRHGDQRLEQFGVQQGALGQFRQQQRRQVVDAVVAVVLQDIEGGALAGAGAAADDDQAHRRTPQAAFCTSTTT
ncbi:hypothetical protein D9M69_329970 [compost metagenome]